MSLYLFFYKTQRAW